MEELRAGAGTGLRRGGELSVSRSPPELKVRNFYVLSQSSLSPLLKRTKDMQNMCRLLIGNQKQGARKDSARNCSHHRSFFDDDADAARGHVGVRNRRNRVIVKEIRFRPV